jgi:2-polyprenyl-3-methyl-5-hydroxy-6-metoxy-1,4-benzoquinol methylase
MNILEIGCGEGAFCASFSDAAEIWGIEPHAASAAIARTRMHTVLNTLFDEARPSLPPGHFDLVICNDVIEHMTDHDAFFRDIRHYMQPDGMLVGSLPNVRFYQNLFNLLVLRDWHYQDTGVLDRTHFRFFTFRSLRRSLEQAGFTVLRLEGLNARPSRGMRPRNVAMRMFGWALKLVSVGKASDTSYVQIGFLVRPR